MTPKQADKLIKSGAFVKLLETDFNEIFTGVVTAKIGRFSLEVMVGPSRDDLRRDVYGRPELTVLEVIDEATC